INFKEALDMPGEQIQVVKHTGTNDGGTMVLTFSMNTFSSVHSFTFIKTTPAGAVQWTKRLVGPSTVVYGNVVQSPDSGYFMCYADYATVSTSYGIMKLSPVGNVVFSNKLNVSAPYLIAGVPEVLAKNDGGFYVACDLIDTVTFNYMWHVFEISAAGNLVWSHAYNLNPAKSYHQGLDTCLNGDLMLAGFQFDPAVNTFVTVMTRVSAAGSPLWTKQYAAPNRSLPAVSVVRMSNDYFYVLAATYNSAAALNECVLMKTDGQGNNLWSFLFSSPTMGLDPYELTAVENNCIVITGSTYTGGTIIKTDSTGQIMCTRAFPNDIWNSMDTIQNGVYSFSGSSATGLAVLMTTGLCGNTCEDTLLTVIKTPLPITVSSPGSDVSIPMTLSANSLPTAFATVHVIQLCSTLGMEEPEYLPATNVYPVPATGTVHVESPEVISLTELLDVHGRVVRSVSVNATSHVLDLSDLAAGVYYLRVSSESKITTRKIVVQH
ncbi:MAG TPA: T9SS type A sorting domain-containing protein, partial [Bacteroidia bacterium]|nr:T9SS type A sorting domain-containing protein [Bacteroidia bacterium]